MCSACMYVCVSVAIGCLSRPSVNALHSPCLLTVSESCAYTCQLNTADIHHQNAAPGFEPCSAPRATVSHNLPVNEAAQCVVSAAGQSQLVPLSSAVDDQSVDRQCHWTQYPHADMSSVLNEQTLVSSRTPCLNAAELSQHPLCDSSSDAAELVSLLQFPFDDSPDITAAEADNAVVMDRGIPESRIELQESELQRDCELVKQPSVHQFSLSLPAADVNYAAAAAVNSCSSEPVNSHDNKYVGDADLQNMSVSFSLSSTNTPHFNNTVDLSNKTDESDNHCLASGTTSPSTLSHVKQPDNTDTLINVSATDLFTVDPPLGTVTVTDSIVVPTEVPLASTVTDLLSARSSASASSLPSADGIVWLTDSKLPDSGQASSYASVELGHVGQVDTFDDACKMSDTSAVVGGSHAVLLTDLEVPPFTTCDSAVRNLVGMTDDKEQCGDPMKLLLLETSSLDHPKSFRNAADGSEASDILLSAVQTKAVVSPITAACSGSANHSSHYVMVSGSHDGVSSQSVTVEQSHAVSDDHQPHESVVSDRNGDKTEMLADIGSQERHSTMFTQKPSDTVESDLALTLQQADEIESDDDDLGENIKMILAKYRVRRGPVGSDSMPVASSTPLDNVLVLDADDPLLQSGHQEDSSIARDTDTCSSSSDDTLASRVKALLIKERQESGSRILPAAVSNVTSQSTSGVPSVCSSRGTAVDYDNLFRELSEIQMKLDDMRNSETSSVGHQCSRSGSPQIRSPDTDVSLMQESLGVFVQQKACIDQLMQHNICLLYTSDAADE